MIQKEVMQENLTQKDITRKGGIPVSYTHLADCTINDAASINAYMKANPDADVKIAAYYEPENEYEIQSSVMCRKEDKALCDAINKAIHEIISDGTAKKLAEQYFGEDFASNVSLYK